MDPPMDLAVGLSSGLEGGTKRQKRGDVLVLPLREEFEGVPMLYVLVLVLTGTGRSRVELRRRGAGPSQCAYIKTARWHQMLP